MHLDFALQFDLRDTAQVLAQDFFLYFELVLVTGVLIMTSAAAAKMRAGRWDTVGRRLHDGGSLRTCESGLFFGECSFDLLSGQNKGNEYSFAASAFFVAGRSGRKAGESVAAIDQLFNV